MLAYLSAPAVIDYKDVKEAAHAIGNMGYSVCFHNRKDTYSKSRVSNADFLVLYGGGWSWRIPAGVRKEIKLASDAHKNIFMLYQRISDKKWFLYDIKIVNDVVTAIAGTAVTDIGIQRQPFVEAGMAKPYNVANRFGKLAKKGSIEMLKSITEDNPEFKDNAFVPKEERLKRRFFF